MSHQDTPSRERLLFHALNLFAANGYESTSTASISRLAGTSESQLVKHFGGKAGLLEEIFSCGWASVGTRLRAQLPDSLSAVDRLRAIPRLLFDALDREPELRELLLLEGRRVRKEGKDSIFTDGFKGLEQLVDETLAEMHQGGQIRADLNPRAIRAALVGLAEGALRDRMLSERAGRRPEFTTANVSDLTDALVDLISVSGGGENPLGQSELERFDPLA